MPEEAIQSYEEMDERQQSLVDAIALDRIDGGERTIAEVAQLAAEKFDTKQYASANVSKYRQKYEDIIDERVQVFANDRNADGADGSETTTVRAGNASYEGPVEGIDATMQHFSERPVQETLDDDVEEATEETPESEEEIAEPTGSLQLLAVDDDMLFRMLRVEDEELARQVFERMQESNIDRNA